MFGLTWKVNGFKKKQYFMSQASMQRWIAWLKTQDNVRNIVILANSINNQDREVA